MTKSRLADIVVDVLAPRVVDRLVERLASEAPNNAASFMALAELKAARVRRPRRPFAFAPHWEGRVKHIARRVLRPQGVTIGPLEHARTDANQTTIADFVPGLPPCETPRCRGNLFHTGACCDSNGAPLA